MDQYFNIIHTEIDIVYSEAALAMYQMQIADSYMTEGVNFDKIEKLANTVIDKIKAMIQKIKDKVTEIIESASLKLKIEKIKNSVKENPELGKTPVNIPDTRELSKLQDSTLKELRKTKDPEALMEKYRKQRNTLLKAGAVITVSLSAAIGLIYKHSDKKIKELKLQADETNDFIQKITAEKNKYLKKYNTEKDKNRELLQTTDNLRSELAAAQTKNPIKKAEIRTNQLASNINYKKEELSEITTVRQKQATASIEVLKDNGTAIIDSVKGLIDAVTAPDQGVFKKAGSIKKGVNDVIGTTVDVATGKQSIQSRKVVANNILDDNEKIAADIKRWTKILNNPNRSKEDHEKAQRLINNAQKTMNANSIAAKGLTSNKHKKKK